MRVRHQSQQQRILVELLDGFDLVIVRIGRNGKAAIEGHVGHCFLLYAPGVGEHQSDAGLVLLDLARDGVVNLNQQSRAGRRENHDAAAATRRRRGTHPAELLHPLPVAAERRLLRLENVR